jgi:hypothetical protein
VNQDSHVNPKLIAAAAVAALAAATPALAHHSFAMFERDKQVTLNGTVKQFQWTNPHSWIVVTVPTADGKSEDWAIESGSPLALVHVGWSRDVFKVGDRVTIVTKPLKNGEHGGSFVSAVLPDGRTLTE